MKRRQWLTYCTGALAALSVTPALADEFVDYTRDVYDAALASGEPFMLDFYAAW